MLKRLRGPAVALFFLAPAVGELLSGSSPPAEFFNPPLLAIMALMYGGGALLVRELVRRWGQGWRATLLLGAAYGILEEGIACKSFFDPGWQDVGILGSYGRWAGVNWVWTLQLTLYHAVFSITLPILLVTLLYPAERDRAWISPRTFKVLAVLFALEIGLLDLVITPYRPSLVMLVLALLAAWALYARARRLAPLPPAAPRVPARARRFLALGFVATTVFFLVNWAVPNSGAPPLVPIALTAGLAAVTWRLVARWSGAGQAWRAPHQLALAAGGLGFLILLAPLQEADNLKRPDDTSGMALVALLFVLLLVWTAWRVRKRAGQSEMVLG